MIFSSSQGVIPNEILLYHINLLYKPLFNRSFQFNPITAPIYPVPVDVQLKRELGYLCFLNSASKDISQATCFSEIPEGEPHIYLWQIKKHLSALNENNMWQLTATITSLLNAAFCNKTFLSHFVHAYVNFRIYIFYTKMINNPKIQDKTKLADCLRDTASKTHSYFKEAYLLWRSEDSISIQELNNFTHGEDFFSEKLFLFPGVHNIDNIRELLSNTVPCAELSYSLKKYDS